MIDFKALASKLDDLATRKYSNTPTANEIARKIGTNNPVNPKEVEAINTVLGPTHNITKEV